jgi:Holliday junction resolvase
MPRFKEYEHDRAKLLAKELEDQGYSVIFEPDPSQIPFSIINCQPDLIATGAAGNLIVEVRTRSDSRSIERYKQIAEEVSKHNGWQFMLSTIDDSYQNESPEIKQELSDDAIIRALARIDSLLGSDSYEMAVPTLWCIFISGMRSSGRRKGLPMDATNDRSVINYMYSWGQISASEYEESKAFLSIRNQLVHTFEANLSKNQVQRLVEFTKQKLCEWGIITLH